MYFRRTPLIVRSIFRSAYWCIPDSDKVFLTFDDGPHPESTPVILDFLEQHNTKASFFCLGQQVEKYPQHFDRILQSGHSIGNHGYEHLSGWQTGVEDYVQNVRKAEALIPGNLFRPPFGKISIRQYLSLKSEFRIVMWTAMPGDFDESQSSHKLIQQATHPIQPGSIITLHDNPKHLDRTLLYLKNLDWRSYKFDKLPL